MPHTVHVKKNRPHTGNKWKDYLADKFQSPVVSHSEAPSRSRSVALSLGIFLRFVYSAL